ncbi:N-acetyltransferase [Streptomyces albospinus]|uniref:N-acetyltransferase n=1 Tax=Streptomyces albospinus TaxID=285515 RepID=A0ABQ2VFW7_9ACTN|nr:GNAT family N-acetyltransferase [Streptomyces albospinus]GGU79702.1 N-acetyltransferase [Streptomyces albospinus]
MTEADIDAVAGVRVRGRQAAYQGLMPRAYLDAMSVAEDARQRRERFRRRRPGVFELVAERCGEVIGRVAVGPVRDPDVALEGGELRTSPPAGELLALCVEPGPIGTGVGRALPADGTDRARAGGFGTLYVWVVHGNPHARRFYERAGFAPDGAEEAYDVAGRRVAELRYRRRPAPAA